MLDRIKKDLVNDLGFEAQVGDTGIVDENGNFAVLSLRLTES